MRSLLTILIVVTTLATASRADDDCAVPMANWQPRAAVQAMAEAQGWTVQRIKIDDGCYEIYGADATGRAIEVMVDPATLEVIEMEYED